MGRLGVSYQDVCETAHIIQGSGHNPTVDRVREHLGTGSRSTIANHLKTWKAGQEGVSSSDDLPPALMQTIQGVWQQLRNEADQTIKIAQETHQEEAKALQKILTETQNTLEMRDSSIRALQSNLKAETLEHTQSKTLLETLQKKEIQWTERQQGLEQQLLNQQDESQRLHAALLSSQKNTEHYQASVQQQREKEHLGWDKQRTAYEQQLQTLRTEVTAHQQAQQNLQREKQRFEMNEKHLSEKCQELEREAKDTGLTLKKTLNEKQCAEKKIQALDAQCDKQEMKLKEQDRLANVFERDNAALREKTQAFEQQHQAVLDSNKELLQKKAFLDGQLTEYKQSHAVMAESVESTS